MAKAETMDVVAVDAVTMARRACGCVGCLGGYPIGAHTLTMPGGVDVLQRPTTCVAGAVLRLIVTSIAVEGGTEGSGE